MSDKEQIEALVSGDAATETKPSPEAPEPEKAPDSEKSAEQIESKPGTPDKALQQVQQNQSAALRRLDELEAKLASGQQLTAKDESKLAQLRELLQSNKLDPLDHFNRVVEVGIEQDERLARLEEQNRQLEARLQAATAQQAWDAARTKYPGVNVEQVFKNCVDEACDMFGVEPGSLAPGSELFARVQRAATKMMDQRADAAAKSVAAKAQPAKTGVTTGASGKVVTSGSGAPPSKEEQLRQDVLSLIRDD